jgi:hypothetical protein
MSPSLLYVVNYGYDVKKRIQAHLHLSVQQGFEGVDGLLGLGLSSESYPRNEENIGQLLTPTGLMYDRGLLEKVMFGVSYKFSA